VNTSKNTPQTTPEDTPNTFNYDYVESVARIACYDDLKSAPHVIEIPPSNTAVYIEALASGIYNQSHHMGSSIPYTVIREVSENFIHAHFKEIVVSIFDQGNTIRFADHGPGIPAKEKAQLPGYSSAVEPMKNYIRGVGSGLPIVREYLESSQGTISIEDNLGTGAVVTISLSHHSEAPEITEDYSHNNENNLNSLTDPYSAQLEQYSQSLEPAHQQPLPATPLQQAYIPGSYYQPNQVISHQQPYPTPTYPHYSDPYTYQQGQGNPYTQAYQPHTQPYQQPYTAGYPQQVPAITPSPSVYPLPGGVVNLPMPALNEREKNFLKFFLSEGSLGVSDMAHLSETPESTTFNTMKKLEEFNLIQKTGTMRSLTPYGQHVAQSLKY
jgi:hypothetical protein